MNSAPETWRDFLLQFLFLEPQPLIAIDELTAFFIIWKIYAFICTSVNHKVYDADHASTSHKISGMYIRLFVYPGYLINTYISPRYIDGSTLKELTTCHAVNGTVIDTCKFRTLTHARQMNNGTTHKRFPQVWLLRWSRLLPNHYTRFNFKEKPTNPFPAGEIQKLRNFLICRLLLNYGCVSVNYCFWSVIRSNQIS